MKLFLTFFLLFLSFNVFAQSKKSEFIYQIITDRFYDGNPNNNCGENDASLSSVDRFLDSLTCDRQHTDWNKYWGGDFEGIITKIPYLKELGVTKIWISPVIENTRGFASGDGVLKTSYHGFWGRDWFLLNERWTNKGVRDFELFDKLLSEAEKAGIDVILDTVVNHTNPAYDADYGYIAEDGKKIADYLTDKVGDEAWFNKHPAIRWELAETEDEKKIEMLYQYMYQHEVKDKNLSPSDYFKFKQTPYKVLQKQMMEEFKLADLADLNIENPKVRDYMKRAHDFWLSKGVDGFRVDTVRHMPIPYFKEVVSEYKAKLPDLFVVGEWYGGGQSNPESMHFAKETGMTIFDFTFRGELRKIFIKKSKLSDFGEFLKNSDSSPLNYDLVNFVDNHDMPRMMSEGATSADMLEMLKIMFLVRGLPCMYYGTEVFLFNKTEGGRDPYNRDMMVFPKDENDGDGVKLVKMLTAFRKKHPQLKDAKTNVLVSEPNRIVFERKAEGSKSILVKISLDNKKFDISKISNFFDKAAKKITYEEVLFPSQKGAKVDVDVFVEK